MYDFFIYLFLNLKVEFERDFIFLRDFEVDFEFIFLLRF